MELSRYDGAVLLYHVAVVLTGGWIVDNFDLSGLWPVYAVALSVGLFWAVYFRLSFVSRLPASYGRAADDAADDV